MGSQYFPARSVLFQKEPSGVTYRVPALIYIPHFSCFLAFCEERLTPADAQAHLLVMRKGTFYKNYVEVRLVLIYVDTIITNKLIEYFFLIKKKICHENVVCFFLSGRTWRCWVQLDWRATAQWTPALFMMSLLAQSSCFSLLFWVTPLSLTS